MQVFGIKNSNLVILGASPFSNINQPARSAEVSPRVLNTPPRSSNILLNSFLAPSRKAATVELASAPGVFRVNAAFQFLKKNFGVPELPITESLQNKSGLTDLRQETLKEIKIVLQNLSSTVSDLRKPGSLNIRSATSSRPKTVKASASGKSPLGKFSVGPVRTAIGNVLVSDEQAPALGALGLTGSFIINGVKVTVQSSDSLVDIKNKINFGEDTNGNGSLDPAEDLNGNNRIDTLTVSASESGPGIFVIEDRNGNGSLDPAEDTNNNDRLDGGTGETQVAASIQANRLVLTSIKSGVAIDLQDDNSILLELGFFQLNGKGLPIAKEQQIDFSSNPPKDLNQLQRAAEIQVDGRTITENSNTFDNAIAGTGLTIKQDSSLQTQIRIFTATGQAAEQIKNFFDNFNESITKINQALRDSSLFSGDTAIQRIRNNILDNTQRDVQKTENRERTIDKVRANRENNLELGLKSVNTGKSVIQETALSRTVQAIKDGVTLPFKNTGKDLLQRLTSVGIRTEKDDTITVNEAQLQRALEINPDSVLDLFNNPETGALTRLDREISRILKTDLGDIDLKKTQIKVESTIPSKLGIEFQRFVSNMTLRDNVKNLIAVA
ncbi:MAG: flagellar filament capping protein FliD [Nitrospinales bacterium]